MLATRRPDWFDDIQDSLALMRFGWGCATDFQMDVADPEWREMQRYLAMYMTGYEMTCHQAQITVLKGISSMV